MFESTSTPPIPRKDFWKRQFLYIFFASSVLGISLWLGVWGYHYYGGLGWIDALLNAAMILTGMGPVNILETDSAKVFASVYALFSGVIFLSTIAVMLAPAVHRFLHLLHFDEED